MKLRNSSLMVLAAFALSACASIGKKSDVSPEQAARIDRELVTDAVIFDSGTKDGAIVPDLSAPRLHAIWVPERIENNRLIEGHREWQLEGDVSILGIPVNRSQK